VKTKQQVRVQFGVQTTQLADAAQTAESAMDQALAFCADKAGLPGPEAALSRLRMGDVTTANYWRYGLARQAAEYLGALDNDVQSIYVADYDATPEDVAFGDVSPVSLIHLIVWVARKTAALTALADALDRALTAECARRLDMNALSHLLDVQIVDDAEVNGRAGYGALIASTQYKPLQVWKRS
jgi:hypothetical protein